MAAFVQSVVGAHPKVERVTKVEDLLPLLQMQRVDAILLPSRLLPEVKMASRLNLSSRELPATVGLPTVAKLGRRERRCCLRSSACRAASRARSESKSGGDAATDAGAADLGGHAPPAARPSGGA